MDTASRPEAPRLKISTAEAGLGFAIRISAEINAGRIDQSIYLQEIKIETGGKGLILPRDPAATQVDLRAAAQNHILLALSASALTTDETLTEVFGELTKETDTNRSAIRTMVKQLRNAFAHSPWRPRWKIYPKDRNRYPIMLDEQSTFVFDAILLDGDGVKAEQVGGLEFWVKVLQHCERAVS